MSAAASRPSAGNRVSDSPQSISRAGSVVDTFAPDVSGGSVRDILADESTLFVVGDFASIAASVFNFELEL